MRDKIRAVVACHELAGSDAAEVRDWELRRPDLLGRILEDVDRLQLQLDAEREKSLVDDGPN